MNTLNFKRLFAVIMTLICAFAYVVFEPASVLAAEIRAENELSENIDAINGIWANEPDPYSPLMGELTEGRDEAVKRFRRADGSYELVAYSDPVHYMTDGKWTAIDNTLVYDEETGRFVNTANDFVVSLASGIDKDSPLLSVGLNGETITMTSVTLPGITDRAGAITGIPAERERKDELTDEEHDQLLRFPEELSSSLPYYSDDGSEVGLEYRLSGKTLSEFITLFEKPEEAPVYTYTFTTTLTPRLEENAVFFENEAGEVVLYFSAPVMRDSKDDECFEFTVGLIANEDGSYTYTLTPDEAWLMSDETVYPVVIDPDINVNFRDYVQNSYVSSSNPAFAYGSNSNTKYALQVGSSNNYHTLIRLDELSPLSTGDVIISASINLTRYVNKNPTFGKEIDAHSMNGIWYEDTVTWNSFSAINGNDPYDSSRIETFGLSFAFEQVTSFDITDLYKRWYTGVTPNYGVVLKSNNYSIFYSSRNSAGAQCHPYFTVVYINSTGLESRFSYSSQSAGRAGTGSVNLYSGNLTFSFADAEITNGTMPISLSHVYNTNDCYDRDDEDFYADIGYGNGWRLNYSQEINRVELTDRTGTQTYYEYIDGDGTRHYYRKKSENSTTEYVNELDKDSELSIDSVSQITIQDKGDNKLVFECVGENNTPTKGRLIRIEDANGNQTKIEYVSGGVIVSGKLNLKIQTITERHAANNSDGQSISFTYSNGHLSSITVPNGLNRTYSYSSGNLLSVGSTDNKSCTYTYSSQKLTQAKDIDNYNLNYTYDSVNRVASVTEKANTTARNSLTFDYGWNVTAVTDNRERSTVYQFNNAGQAVSVRDPEGNAVYAAYNTQEQTTTQLAAVSKMQHTVVNLLKNSGFDADTLNNSIPNWTVSGASLNGTHFHTGRKSLELYSNQYSDRYAVQTVSLTAGKTYTLSARFTGASGALLKVYYGNTLLGSSDPVQTLGGTSDWVRGSVTFHTPSGSQNLSVDIWVMKPYGVSGTIYVDSVQLEEGNTPSRYNMIENGDFSDTLTAFDGNGFDTGDGVVTLQNGEQPTHPSYLSNKVLKIEGSCLNEFVTQTINVNGHEGDTYSFGGWCASDSVPMNTQYGFNSTTNTFYSLLCGERSIYVAFLNGSDYVSHAVVYFGADTTDWQFASSSAVADGDYTQIEISVRFCQSRNTAYFDGIQLYREEFSQGYTYDQSTGNLTGYTSLLHHENSFEYDNDNNLTSATDARGNTTTYTYDGDHNLLTTTTPLNVVTTNTYNSNGQVTQTKVGDSTDYIKASTSYYSSSALAHIVTDARGNSVSYSYDTDTRQQTTVTDAESHTSTYSYGNAASMLRLASLTSPTGKQNATATVSYSYSSEGRLSTISRGSTSYSFTYDIWGSVLQTKVGSTALSGNVYDSFGRLSYVEYANNILVGYIYDSLDRVKAIYKNTVSGNTALAYLYEFIYNNEGDLYELRNYDTHRATFFEYDHAGRCMASTEKSFTGSYGNPVAYTGTVSGYRYEYDENNNLTKLTCTVAGSTWETVYTYDDDNRPSSAAFGTSGGVVDFYDSVGRRYLRRLWTISQFTDINETYVSGANGSKTALVSTYKNGSDDAYNYSYDANGNITEITKGSMSFTYDYDKANQLVRENLYYGNGNSNNATYAYEYDLWGNLITKKRYIYTTLNNLLPGSELETICYTYGDSQWKDKLTSFNGSTISYDAMGNPTSYLGNTLVWEGKKLKQLTIPIQAGITHRPTVCSYEYDENGLRLEKTVNGTTTEYYYNGSVLIGMKIGTGNNARILRFSYDASGNVMTVAYSTDNGSNFTTYFYLRNAQNDIVKLIDNTGAAVVEYIYDSWGKILSVTGTLTTTLGKDQPFRYRGYVYDTETQLYYLQSRYYDPNTCRFISADIYLSTGQGVLGHNAFAYCNNNPVALTDEGGCVPSYNVLMTDTGGSNVVMFDVPVYGQTRYSLCWAFCQIMIESYHTGIRLSQDEATQKAIILAKSFCLDRYDSTGMDFPEQEWNKGRWPTNVLPDGKSDVYIDDIDSLFSLLKNNGPVYSYYRQKIEEGRYVAHVVVVVGVDLANNVVYTINPQGNGCLGTQSFEQFKQYYYGSSFRHETQYCLVPVY